MAFYASLQNTENQSGVSFKATPRLLSMFQKSGMTRQALADEAECHVNTIYRLIRGQGVDIRIAQAACDILGVSFEEGIESTKPVHQLAGKTINHHHRLISSISIHSLRHTNITLLLAAGIPLKTVSYRAGHAQTSTTSNIYSHAIRSADEKAAEVLEHVLR